MKNRTPDRKEIAPYLPLIKMLVHFFDIETVLCIGRKAEEAIKPLQVHFRYVRHPANGGVRAFRKQL